MDNIVSIPTNQCFDPGSQRGQSSKFHAAVLSSNGRVTALAPENETHAFTIIEYIGRSSAIHRFVAAYAQDLIACQRADVIIGG